MTLKNGFGKCSLSVLSANGWKDQNRALKPLNGKGIVRLANRVAVWRRSEVLVDSGKFTGMKLFHPSVCLTNQKSRAFLYPFDKPIKSLYFVCSFCYVRAFESFQGHAPFGGVARSHKRAALEVYGELARRLPGTRLIGSLGCVRGGRHSREVWGEMCRWILQTLALFETKIIHFATLFKARDLINFMTLTRFVLHTELDNFSN